MGIGRREFLRFTSIALAGLAINPLQAVITNENIYINRSLGIMFEKPSDWIYVDVKDFGSIKNDQVLGNGIDDIDIDFEFSDPICIITKYPINDDYKEKFSPTITVHLIKKDDLIEVGCSTFEEMMIGSEEAIGMYLKDFQVNRRYNPYFVSGCKVYELDSTYTFVSKSLKAPVKVELKTMRTEHNDYYYDINFHQSYEWNEIAENEFISFKNSLKLI